MSAVISCDEVAAIANRLADDLFLRIRRLRDDGWQVLHFWSSPMTDRPEKYRFVEIGMKTFWKKRKRVP